MPNAVEKRQHQKDPGLKYSFQSMNIEHNKALIHQVLTT